jgi:hypothetical protein
MIMAGLGWGCGSSSGVDSSAAIASCNGYCDAYIGAACSSSTYTSVAMCKTEECGHLATAPAACQAPLKTFYDCEKTQADICGDTGCRNELAALANCH